MDYSLASQGGEALREFRKARALTQEQLASLLGILQSEISAYETGDHKPVRLMRMALKGVDATLAEQGK